MKTAKTSFPGVLLSLFLLCVVPAAVAQQVKPDSTEKRLESLRSFKLSALNQKQLFDVALIGLELTDDLIDEKKFGDAAKAAALARTAAKKANSTYLYKSSQYYSKYALELEAEFQKVAKYQAVLKTGSEKEKQAAARELGLFYCLDDGDWKRGLPLLKACDDKALVALANRELQFPPIAVDQIKLGDLWAEYAAKGDSALKTDLMQRAKYWYLKALPQLSVVERAALVRRINRIPQKTFQLNIAVRIDGSDRLILSTDRLYWQNLTYQYPSILVMNGIRWDTREVQELPNRGGTRALPHRLHLATARLKKLKGRGPVTLKIEPEQIHVTFDDGKPPGANDYVINLTFDSY
ncbi:hypothetical protein Enr10x_22250 [Gimesia panareensis]|uniref:Uncharacterized protein n=1 Tax=Gimesia panareensis TaxID=2527978 RepID=A0A517Q5N3_9PLAN|nr:hypothetical protein [Gimesia panareensis]QDT26913.1 hypothetical protein Enr10x_22250 [Gimesia panareensis]